MLYAIVCYDETCETDFVPLKWLTGGFTLCGVAALVENRSTVQFYWPPLRNSSVISSTKKRCIDAESEWPVYSARILSTASRQAFQQHEIVCGKQPAVNV